MKRGVSIRRLSLLYTLGMTAALSLLSLMALLVLKAIAVPAITDNLERKATMSVERLGTLDVALATEDAQAFEQLSNELSTDEDFRYLAAIPLEGTPLYVYGERPAGMPRSFSPGHMHSSGTLRFVSKNVEFEGLQLGTVVVAYSSAAVTRVNTWIIRFIVTAVLLFIVGLFFSLRLSRHIARPIHAMIDFTKNVGKGDLDQRIEVDAGAAEFQYLASHLNTMTKDLRARDAELASAHEELERHLQTLRETREQLLSSTRLAAAGEMAGHTAHEVLNPVSSIHGRLNKLLDHHNVSRSEDFETIREILGAWDDDFQNGGFEALLASLGESVDDEGTKTLFEEDLQNLKLFLANTEEEDRSILSDLQFLKREVDRIAHIVDGMRSMARSSGTPETLPLLPLIDESIDVLKDKLDKCNITTEVICPPKAQVHADRYELIQVLTNLIKNAQLAIEEDRGREGGQIIISVDSVDDTFYLRITDDGPGIAKENQPLIFESSFTTRSSSKGTGLGLGIARRLVRSFEGDLFLEESEVGVGTIFLLVLRNPIFEDCRPKAQEESGVVKKAGRSSNAAA